MGLTRRIIFGILGDMTTETTTTAPASIIVRLSLNSAGMNHYDVFADMHDTGEVRIAGASDLAVAMASIGAKADTDFSRYEMAEGCYIAEGTVTI